MSISKYISGEAGKKVGALELMHALTPLRAKEFQEKQWKGRKVSVGKVLHEFNKLIDKFLTAMGMLATLEDREKSAANIREQALREVGSNIKDLSKIIENFGDSISQHRAATDSELAPLDIKICKQMEDRLVRMKNIVIIIHNNKAETGSNAKDTAALINGIEKLITVNQEAIRSFRIATNASEKSVTTHPLDEALKSLIRLLNDNYKTINQEYTFDQVRGAVDMLESISPSKTRNLVKTLDFIEKMVTPLRKENTEEFVKIKRAIQTVRDYRPTGKQLNTFKKALTYLKANLITHKKDIIQTGGLTFEQINAIKDKLSTIEENRFKPDFTMTNDLLDLEEALSSMEDSTLGLKMLNFRQAINNFRSALNNM